MCPAWKSVDSRQAPFSPQPPDSSLKAPWGKWERMWANDLDRFTESLTPLLSGDKTGHWKLLQNQMIYLSSSARIPPLKESLRQQAPPLIRLTEIVMSFVAQHSQGSKALAGTTLWLVGNGRGEAQAPEEEVEAHKAESPAGAKSMQATQGKGRNPGERR